MDPLRWSSYMGQLLQSRQPPALGSVDIDTIETQARNALKDNPAAFAYLYGGAGTSTTTRDNIRAFDKYKLIPRMLIDTSRRHLRTILFGTPVPCPIIISPMGAQGLIHQDGELATARASKATGVPMVLSTPSTRALEVVAAEQGPNALRWFQLYWPRTPEVTLSLLTRAKAAGFSALVLTLDTTINGWRTSDILHAYAPAFHARGAQNLMSDPVFMARLNLAPIPDYRPPFPYDPIHVASSSDPDAVRDRRVGPEYFMECHGGVFRSWDEVRWIRDNWDGPLVLKGIQTLEDAEKALEYGANGIVVSNHGGRQIDGALPSVYALEEICAAPSIKEAQASGRLTVLFDSGIRNGSHVFKALALGAQAVLVARPVLYGLAVAGEMGVEEVLRNILAELEISMGLAGYSSVDEIIGNKKVIRRLDWA